MEGPPQDPTRPADLILASASPRRRELLERLGLVVQIYPVDLDETPRAAERPGEYVRRLAAEKCDAARERLGAEAGDRPILAADTTVVLDGEIFGKPADAAEAGAMLGRLAGRRHEVTTAYRIRRGEVVIDRAIGTAVTFRLLAPAEIEAYVASGEWQGKAGGYAIQGIAALFATELRGSLTNVVGLPLAEAIADLRAAGGLPAFPPAGFGLGASRE
jgi:septum formation protein